MCVTIFEANKTYVYLYLQNPLFFRYRHYGVYLTHENDQQLFQDGEEDSLDILRNPVIVLDKNAESYINLRYPTLSQHDLDKKC